MLAMSLQRKSIRSFNHLFILSVCLSFAFATSPQARNATKRTFSGAQGQGLGLEGSKKYQVVILGAGIAGITAAKTLYEAGIEDFLVLEATGRVGGRLLKAEFPDGSVVEFGANWVHGTDSNPIWDLVKEARLQGVDTMIEPTEGKYIVFDASGRDVTILDDHQGMEEANECLQKLIALRKESGEDDLSMQAGLAKCGWFPNTPAKQAIEYYYNDFDGAVPSTEISCGVKLRSGGHIDSTGGRQVLISDKAGYATIVQNMAMEFGEEKVQKNRAVRRIEWGKETVRIEVDGMMGGLEAEHVLVTFSVGVLQKHLKTMFKPALPVPFQDSLGMIDMTNYLKIFLMFAERFWPKGFDYFFYPGSYPVWQNLPGGKTEIPANDNILLVTVTGQEAWELGKIPADLVEERIRGQLLGDLKKVFGEPLPELLEIRLKNWGNDEFFLGAYSNPKVNTESRHFDILTRPIGGRLYFAGEGTSELYYGFAHGAYLTGKDQANKIIAVIQKEQSLKAMEMTTQKDAILGWNYVLRGNIDRPGNRSKS